MSGIEGNGGWKSNLGERGKSPVTCERAASGERRDLPNRQCVERDGIDQERLLGKAGAGSTRQINVIRANGTVQPGWPA